MREETRPKRHYDDPNCGSETTMACRENARIQLDELVVSVEKKLDGLRKLQKLAELASDDPWFESVLSAMVLLYRNMPIGQEA